jgi:hypothetical protein
MLNTIFPIFYILTHTVKLKQTPEEKKAKKRVYRSGYVQKPHVKAKREADKLNPEIIERNLLYATNPIVVARRTDLATERRGVPSKLKKDHPKLWAQYCPLAAAPRTRANLTGVKRKRSSATEKKVDSVSLEPTEVHVAEKSETPKKKVRLEPSKKLEEQMKPVKVRPAVKILRKSPPPAPPRHAIRA